jgi:serine/threonine protein kinase/DNA-binding response OmpR family regulator
MANVLVVEDNVDMANVVRSLLEFENHAVDLAFDGAVGLEYVLANPYDLVVLDWELPERSGLEILTEFRKSGAKTPVIILTGKDSFEDKEAGLDSGADDYLTKPFNMKELAARVRALLRRTNIITLENISLTDIDLDLANKRATRNGRTHALPAHEFKLLELAARYPHIKPDVAHLLKVIWPETEESGEEKLRTAIRRLRKKFDPAAKVIFPHLYRDGFEKAGIAEIDFDPIVGTIFNGKYELLELVGGGGSGLVYRARHIALGNHVALKVLHLHATPQFETIRRFQREAKLTAQLAHPNIVTVRDFGLTEQGAPYLVMELLDGASLSELMAKHGPPPLLDVIDFFAQACDGLAYAHQKGLVHRDLKPSNLMLVKGPHGNIEVKIVDFGLARATDVEGSAKITATGHVLGSPPYMSPEQCRGEVVDARADIYSLGCALFEALEGKPPFPGSTAVEVLVKHVTVPAPEAILPGVAPIDQVRVNKVLTRCLHKDKGLRFQSAFELKAALLQLKEEQDSGHHAKESSSYNLPDYDSEKSDRPMPWAERKERILHWIEQHISID